MMKSSAHRSKRNARGRTILVVAGFAALLGSSAAIAHSVFVEGFSAQILDVVLDEFDPHITDDRGNPIPIDVFVSRGVPAKIIIRDNIGCKATIGVASASTFVTVEPSASDGPVVEQTFTITGDSLSAGQNQVPLVIGWEGDGETIVVNDVEIVCDEILQATFRVTFSEDLEDEQANENDNDTPDEDRDPAPGETPDENDNANTGDASDQDETPSIPAPSINIPCGPGIIAPLLFATFGLSLTRRRRR